MSPETVHIRPHEPVAERVLLPGDPGRALRLAQQLITGVPKMLNHNRGLWGYSGVALDGHALTVQATGIGGPSAAIVAEELIMLGARRLLRVGTCGALSDSLELGQLLSASAVLPGDGTSRALGANGRLLPDRALQDRLQAPAGTVVSSDLFYDPDPARVDEWRAAGAVAIEMEAATLLMVAARHALPAACVCVVSDIVSTHERIGEDALLAAEQEMGGVALAALAL
jgi:DeoD family purine-nucleoside phosphorylase